MKFVFLLIVTCALSSVAEVDYSSVEQRIALERDRIVRSKDPNEAVKLLTFIEQQDFPVAFNMTGGPFDVGTELFATVNFCFDFLSENTLDSRWGNLARVSVNDRESIAQMLASENVGERTLALRKLETSSSQRGCVDQLSAIQQDDPLVIFAGPSRGMRPPGAPPRTEPIYGKFVAYLRSMARDELKKQGVEVGSEEAFKQRYEEFGVERLLGIYGEGDRYLTSGVLGVFLAMDPDSYGGKYLNAMEHHDRVPDGNLYILKQHLNKKMDITTGSVRQEDLDRALEGWDGNVPVIVSSQKSVRKEPEDIVSRNFWKMVFPVTGILLVVAGVAFKVLRGRRA